MKRKMIGMVVMLLWVDLCTIQAQNQTITGSKNTLRRSLRSGISRK
ncbi:MAG: hypothetical protein LUE93_16610 [Bacteroides sp.]|nr:hypothetical protein [Bacteroides sp.]